MLTGAGQQHEADILATGWLTAAHRSPSCGSQPAVPSTTVKGAHLNKPASLRSGCSIGKLCAANQ